MHGVFNLRPKLPDQRWTRTPWHQDSQYYPSNTRVHTISIWMPLMRVTTENSCLQVAEGYHRGDMYAITEDEETGFLRHIERGAGGDTGHPGRDGAGRRALLHPVDAACRAAQQIRRGALVD